MKIKSLVSIRRKDLPKILLIKDFLTRDQIESIHHSCDAFVLPHHGEGWGMPIHDAINHNNSIITTKYGGITEWLNDDNSFVISHKIGPVKPMNWNPWYDSRQNWAMPSLSSLKNNMTTCFNDKALRDKRKSGLENIVDLFTISRCSESILEILSSNRFRKHS